MTCAHHGYRGRGSLDSALTTTLQTPTVGSSMTAWPPWSMAASLPPPSMRTGARPRVVGWYFYLRTKGRVV